MIPGAAYLWRNGQIRDVAALCGNPANWNDFNITQVSPEKNFLIGTAAKDDNGDGKIDVGTAEKPGPDKRHGVLLLPIKVRFAKPVDATWSDLDEKQVMLYSDELHVHVTIPMALTSLDQVMAIPALSKIHLKTDVTKPAGVDVPVNYSNTAFLTGTDPSTGQANCELRIVLQRTDVQNLGLRPTNDADGVDEKTWYDWGDQSTSSTHNLTDSMAFDAASPAVSLGQASNYGHLSDKPPKKPNSPLDKTYLKEAGREVITVSMGGLEGDPRAIAHQADTFYISTEGHIATGLLDTQTTPPDTFGASDADWNHSLNTVIIAGCSVLNIKGYRMSELGWTDTRLYWQLRAINAQTTPFSPGEAWEGTGPKYLLSYAFHAPRDDQGSAEIATTYETLVAGGMNPVAAWGQANNGTTGNNACAIDVSVSPHKYWYLKRDVTSSTGLTWTSVTKTGTGWP